MLHGRRLDPSSRVIGGRAKVLSRAQRLGIRLAGSPPTPAISARTALRDRSARAPACGHLNPTPDWRADATPGRGEGGDRGANGEPGTGPEGLPACFPGLPRGELVAEGSANCAAPSLSLRAETSRIPRRKLEREANHERDRKGEREGGVQKGESGGSHAWVEKEVCCVVAVVLWESPGLQLES